MNFVCAELLSLSHSFQFWGEMANYRDVDNISIRGRIMGSGNDSISGVWTGMAPYFNFTGYEPILINGYNIGTGRLVSVNFDESTDVTSKSYQASLEILKTGNLWNLTGSFYSGFYGTGASIFKPDDLYNPKYLNSFREDFTFSTKKSGEYEYDRSVSLEVDGSYPGTFLNFCNLVAAQSFIQSNDVQIINAVYPSYYTDTSNPPVTKTTKTYDEINRRYTATQSFIFDTGNPWTWNYRHILNYSKDGYITVSENGDIKSTRHLSTIYSYADIGWQTVESGIFGRVSGFYNYYITGQPNNIYSGNCDALINYPTNSSLSKNKLIGEYSYSKSYTDNPSQKSGYFFGYQNDISANSDGNIIVSEDGQYKGLHSDRISGFASIYSAYQSGTSAISGRISGFYTGSLGYLFVCASGRNLNKLRTEETYREYFQELNYSYQFTDDRSIINDNNFYSIKATYSNQKPVLQVGYFNLINDSEIAQKQSQSTLGTFNNRISIIGRPTTSITTYLSGAYNKIIAPSGSEVWLSDMSYSLSKNNNEFGLNMEYTYSDYPGATDLLV